MNTKKQLNTLAQAMLALQTKKDLKNFLADLCTPQELEDLCLRWQIVDELNHGFTYREISARTKASLTTIGRIAKSIKYGTGGYQKAYDLAHQADNKHHQ